MNINDVSKELHVHRNTISYRLNLIKEKLLIDYTDIRKLRNIVLSHEVKKMERQTSFLKSAIPHQFKLAVISATTFNSSFVL